MLAFLLVVWGLSIPSYKTGQHVVPLANIVGPRDNIAEIYTYRSLPFCRAEKRADYVKTHSLGDSLSGNHLTDIGIRLSFGENQESIPLCDLLLNKGQVERFTDAINRDFWVQFFLDDLGVWMPIGANGKLFTRYNYIIGHDEGHITDVNISGDKPVSLTPETSIPMSISVVWKAGHPKRNVAPAGDRRVHRFALMNSALLSLLLVVMVSLLLSRILARDYNRYIQEAAFDGFEIDLGTEQGWKALHGDVFRPPSNFACLTVLSGAGLHLTLFALVVGLCLLRTGYAGEKDSSIHVAIICFLATSPIAGFAAVTLGRAFGYQKWLRLTIGSIGIVPLWMGTVYVVMGCFGRFVGSAHTVSIFALLILVVLELLAVVLSARGGVFALKAKIFEVNKCEVALVPRHIPTPPWYLRRWAICVPVGLLCGVAIVFEMYYLLSSMWHHFTTYVWGYFLVALVLLVAVTACTTILAVYFLLQNEIHHWQWPSFLAPASAGVSVFAGSVYYLIARTKIRGVFQMAYYLSCMGSFSAGVGLVCGGIGFLASNIFVHKIFSSMKLD
jgi:transmembrane 9 superfamily protein 3